jgi:hypothetical protein
VFAKIFRFEAHAAAALAPVDDQQYAPRPPGSIPSRINPLPDQSPPDQSTPRPSGKLALTGASPPYRWILQIFSEITLLPLKERSIHKVSTEEKYYPRPIPPKLYLL